MAKRFTDTDKWKMAWFRKLGSEGRDLWSYLHDNCDFAGFFEIDCERITFELGFPVNLERIESVLNGKYQLVASDRIFLPAFIEFQYGSLSETSKPHLAVIKKMKVQRVWEGFAKGYATLKDKDKDKDQDKDKETEKEKGGMGEIKLTPIAAASIDSCKRTWIETLTFFGVPRTLMATEELEIGRAILKYGAENVQLALAGARFEPKTEGFDPKKYISIGRILTRDKDGKERIDRFISYGIEARTKTQAKAKLVHQQATSCEEPEPTPEEVEAAKEKFNKIKGGSLFRKMPTLEAG